MQDICYDPQTSGGLLMAIPEEYAQQCLEELQASIPQAAMVGYVTEQMDAAIYLE
jgi:selenide,water dikinase